MGMGVGGEWGSDGAGAGGQGAGGQEHRVMTLQRLHSFALKCQCFCKYASQ